jgi:signal transduction histidine kinase
MDNKLLQTQLRKIVHDRGQYTAWPNIFFVVISLGLLERMLRHDYKLGFGLLAVLIGSIFRIILASSKEVPVYLNESRWRLYHFVIILIGLGWGTNYIFVHLYYGLESTESLYTMLILVGLLSGGITTLSSSPPLYLSYVISALIIPIVHFIYDYNEPGHLLVAVFIIIFCSFHFYHASMSYDVLKRSILNDQNLIEQRDRIQALINAVPGFVSFIDENLKYQIINEYGKALYNQADIIGRPVGYLHPDSEFSLFVQDFMKSDKIQQTSELKIEASNLQLWFIVTIKKIETSLKGAVIVSVPIDELVKTRKDLEAQQAKAHYAAKLASLGEMAASIAHEINNPLAIIHGSAEQLSREFNKESITKDRGEKVLSKIIETTERISKIVRSLKTLSRNGDKDPFSNFILKDVIDDCIEISRQKFYENQITLEIGTIPKDLSIHGQQVQISQVLMNLISNASHAIENEPLPRWIKITMDQSEHFIELKVIDSGHGIPEIISERIMEPFFTTKDVGKGTGLGLSISKSIIEDHGGTLKLDESAPNTTFIITLPVSVKDKIS